MNTRAKMQRTNSDIKKKMLKLGYNVFFVAPHSRFSKDIVLEMEGFDALATKKNKLIFCQWKTRKRPSKKNMENYKALEKKYGIKCIWCTKEIKTTTTKKGEIKIYESDL